ncbi:hypothetical protein Golob_017754, partial [Gossypium lobatum]|nr:hypothetical protein [Gossypium lobatum]
MLYTDPKIQECVLDELLANRSIWHVKVPLMNFAMVEMQESDRVIRETRGRLDNIPQEAYRDLATHVRLLVNSRTIFHAEVGDIFRLHGLVQESREAVSTVGFRKERRCRGGTDICSTCTLGPDCRATSGS